MLSRPVGKVIRRQAVMTEQLDPEHLDFQSMCRTFTDKQVRPLVAEAEAEGFPALELWREMGAAGLLGLMT
ncbi:acyl-CoA dehydrogenase family protein, partial [Streptomyces rhizosphaericus]|uniref:acyl-CoA dehydrogenase family protein n=1 Tax=Streptomyces rhizosphaericus TaxID=114699 RepID=UPI003CD0A697